MSNKDELRSKLLSSKKPKTVKIEIFDTTIELHQPNLRQMMSMQDQNNGRDAIANILITQSYVPGTNERIFEDTDKEAIMEWPVGNG